MKIENAKIRDVSDELMPKKNFQKRISVFQEGNRTEIAYLDIDSIKPYKHQARREFDEEEIESLSQTIRDHGLRQPLTVLQVGEKEYEVISGERRLRASKISGLKKVPCLIIDDEIQAEKLALIENVQRKDLTLLELGEGFKGLLDRQIFASQSEIAKKLGINRSKIVDAISLAGLPESVKEVIAQKKVYERDTLRELLKLGRPAEQIKYLNNLCHPNEARKTSAHKVKRNVSVLRFSMEAAHIKVQKNGISRLSAAEKQLLKSELLRVLEEL